MSLIRRVEKEIAAETIKGLLAQAYRLTVNNGEDEEIVSRIRSGLTA